MSNPKKPTGLGPNLTGAATSPLKTKSMVKGAEVGGVEPTDPMEAIRMRVALSRGAPPVGQMPPPATAKGMVKTAVAALKGDLPTVLLDKLGERLAFERTGSRLYDAALIKFEASDQPVDGQGPTREALESIREDEIRHAGIVLRAIETMGADPTAITPCADIAGVASMGLIQALGDPRTTFTQALNVLLMAELTDVAAWTLLADLAAQCGHDEMATEFRQAQQQELTHEELIKGWLEQAVLGQASGTSAGRSAEKGQRPQA